MQSPLLCRCRVRVGCWQTAAKDLSCFYISFLCSSDFFDRVCAQQALTHPLQSSPTAVTVSHARRQQRACLHDKLPL